MNGVPDLSYYAQGLDASSFPVLIEGDSTSLNVDIQNAFFSLTTLEKDSVRIQLDSRGFTVVSLHNTPIQSLATNIDETTSPTTTDLDTELSTFDMSTMSIGELSSSTSAAAFKRRKQALDGFVFETIEALLMALSPQFEQYFANALTRKLEESLISSSPSRRWTYSSDEGDGDHDTKE